MSAIASQTFTVRNVTEGRRDATGALTITHLGDVTVTLQGMSRAEIAEWEWATDALNIGLTAEIHRMTVNGWKVFHSSELIGYLFQGAGTRVHAEWIDPTTGDSFATGYAARLRHGAAQIVKARQAAGHGLPVDATPEPVRAPAPTRPVWYADDTEVLYHGSLQQLRGRTLRVEECECYECDGYQLYTRDVRSVVARHVRHTSVTAAEEVTAALVAAA